MLFASGCDSANDKTYRADKTEIVKHPVVSKIVVGLYEGDLANGEMLFDGNEELEYYLNDQFLGKSEGGANQLLEYLKIKNTNDIVIQNPATSFVGGVSHKPGLRDEKYKYPYIKNARLSKLVNAELDRIRGWSDSVLPLWNNEQ